MNAEERVARIGEMEEALNQALAAVGSFGQSLGDFEAAQPAIAKLSAYYGSEEWFGDREADGLPADLACGVLGEDVPYGLLVGYRDLAIRMLEVATRALKDC